MTDSQVRPRVKRIRSERAPRTLLKVVRRLHASATRHRIGSGGVTPHPNNTPRVIVKARIVRNRGSSKVLVDHLRYLGRDGEDAAEVGPRFYDADGDLDGLGRQSFRELGSQSRHHFRLIVSPDQAEGLDLTVYTRAVVAQMEQDLGTQLRWLAANHFDTEHPHAHVVVHGLGEEGNDLVLRRDYLANGIRHRAQALADLMRKPSPELIGDLAIHQPLRSSNEHKSAEKNETINRDLLPRHLANYPNR